MASSISKYFGNKIVRWMAGQAMPTAPANLYIGLFNGDPKAGGTEITTSINPTGRKAITWSVPAANDIDNLLSNSSPVDFGASANDTTISHTALFDAQVGGKRLASKALIGGAVSIAAQQPVSFGAGDIQFEVGE